MPLSLLLLPTAHTISPEDYGAAADGLTDDTVALRRACSALGAGDTLLFRSGRTYLSGPFSLANQSNITLRIDGTIQALNMTAWPERDCAPNLLAEELPSSAGLLRTCSPFVRFSEIDGLTIMGGERGVVDGAGALWWAEHDKDPKARIFRPHLLEFNSVSRLLVDGVRTHNPPNHHLRVNDCSRVRIQRWSAYSPGAPNTDGVNFAGGFDQAVINSTVWNGDDCVTAIASATWPVAGGEASPAVLWRGGSLLVQDVHCNHSHGISIGSVRHGVIRNVTVRNVTIANGENGIRIKSYPNGTGAISGISYDGVTIHNVRSPIVVDGFYCPPTQRPYPCHAGATAVKISNVSIANVAGDAHRGSAGYVDCDPSAPCEGLVLRAVHFVAAAGQPTPLAFNCNASDRKHACTPGCGHARGTVEDVVPDVCVVSDAF